MSKMRFLIPAAILSAFAWPAAGHHSFTSQYDMEKIVEIAGTVTEVWYQNPHARVYVEVADDDGSNAIWETETYPRNILDRRGWKYDDLKVGDDVVVTAGTRRQQSPANADDRTAVGRLGRRRLRCRLDRLTHQGETKC